MKKKKVKVRNTATRDFSIKKSNMFEFSKELNLLTDQDFRRKKSTNMADEEPKEEKIELNIE
ncbi:hypothetical protein RJG79_11875 [Mycoplasmatota bacterium WC44]